VTLIAIGTAISVISLFVPWFSGRTTSSEVVVSPILERALSGPTVVVAGAMVGGFVLYVIRGNVGLLGCAAALLFNTTLLIWLFGASLAAWIPSGILPTNPVVSLEVGVSSALMGSLLTLVGICVILVEQTWGRRSASLSSWQFLVGVAVACGALYGRGIPIVRAEASGFEWSFAADAVPILGDLLGFIGLAVALLALAAGVLRWRLGAVLLMIASAAYLLLAGVVVISGSLLERAGRTLADQFGVSGVEVSSLLAASGLAAAAAVGGLVLAVACMCGTRPLSVATVPGPGPDPSLHDGGSTPTFDVAPGDPGEPTLPF